MVVATSHSSRPCRTKNSSGVEKVVTVIVVVAVKVEVATAVEEASSPSI